MAKRNPFTAQQERLERLITNVRREVADIKTMVDTERSILTAQYVKIDDPASPQILKVSEEGGLEMGGATLPWREAITVEASHTGDTDETEVGKITVPGGSMGPNGVVRIFTSFRGMGAGYHYFRIYFGGLEIKETYYAANNLMVDVLPTFVWNRDSVSSQGSGHGHANVHVRTTEAPFNGEVDTSQDVDISLRVKNAVPGETAYLSFVFVEAFYRD